uniref:Uncharacterized protein n=1 Tax=Arundo donax TaxID=35708 RepID=A0A0A9ASV2_ARUDO
MDLYSALNGLPVNNSSGGGSDWFLDHSTHGVQSWYSHHSLHLYCSSSNRCQQWPIHPCSVHWPYHRSHHCFTPSSSQHSHCPLVS